MLRLSLRPRGLLSLLLLLPLLLLPPPSGAAEPGDREGSEQLEAVRSAILSRLRLSAPPDVRPQLLSSAEVRRLQRRYEEALSQLRTNQSLEAASSGRSSSSPRVPKVRILMPKLELNRYAPDVRIHLLLHREALIEGEPGEPRVLCAQLRLFLQPPSPLTQKERATSRLDAAPPSLMLDLTRPLQRWLRRRPAPAPLLRLPLALPPNVSRELLRQSPGPRASLRVELQELPRRAARRTRAPGPDKACGEGGENRCCLRSQRVSFKEIGWDSWVLAPREFEMRFCEGSCPQGYRPASMHAQLKARLHRVSPASVGPPCCVPSAYEPMLLMHYGSDGLIAFTPYEDLLPTDCHCA
ncbi:growth/differentiation factor 15-like [Sminthopsis crassicaudata]|uniref:growth/differentiation factor 15-like n=1 Tax=Sminthopsis crassicaudata TaxID=9301 RepID=UPI003D69EAA2